MHLNESFSIAQYQSTKKSMLHSFSVIFLLEEATPQPSVAFQGGEILDAANKISASY
jgi:hypothetical protein